MPKQMTLNTDQHVWEAFLRGDHTAFDRIYTRYFSLLFRYGLRFTSDRDLIKDVLQDLFTELFARQQNLPLIRRPGSYLMVCLRRKLFRSRNLSARHSPENLQKEPEYDFCLELSPEHQMIAGEQLRDQQKHLQHAILQLTSRQKEAVYLYFYESLSYEEIAGILDLKEIKYARTLIYRAVAALRKDLHKSGSALLLLWFMRPSKLFHFF